MNINPCKDSEEEYSFSNYTIKSEHTTNFLEYGQ